MSKNVREYITEFSGNVVKVYDQLSEPGIEGSCGFTSYGDLDDSPGTPGKVISKRLIYTTNVNFINKCYDMRYLLCPKSEEKSLAEKADEEMFKIGMDLMLKGHPAYLCTLGSIIGRVYKPYNKNFYRLVNTQYKLNKLLELKKDSKNDYLVEYIESDWYNSPSNYLSCSETFIEKYINDNYKLPIGYRFIVSVNDIMILGPLNLSGYFRCFDTIKLEVIPPTGYINDEKIIIYNLDIHLDKLHVGVTAARIDFDAIDKVLNDNIKDIIDKCKEYDKSYLNRNIKQDRYSINFGKEREIISKYEIEKIKEYHMCIERLIEKYRFISFRYKFYTETSKIKYNKCGVIEDINAIQIFLCDNSIFRCYNKPLITIHDYGFEEIGVNEFENEFEIKILPMLGQLYEFKKIDGKFNKVDREVHTFLCSLRDDTIKLNTHNEIEDALKIRKNILESIRNGEENKRIQEKLGNNEIQKIKNIIKRIFNL